MDNFCMADPCSPDLARLPALANARALEGELQPGDVLWLPRFHWHHVRQLGEQEENLSLNFWVGTKGAREVVQSYREAPLDMSATVDGGGGSQSGDAGGDDGSRDGGGGGMQGGDGGAGCHESVMEGTALGGAPPAPLRPAGGHVPAGHAQAVAWLHASRMVESAASSMFGDMGGAFITTMGAGEDACWPTGSRARTVADRMRAELSGVLGGGGAVRTLLHSMTRDGRLHPGIAPPVMGPVVSAEPRRGDLRTTPPEQMERLRAEAERYNGSTR